MLFRSLITSLFIWFSPCLAFGDNFNLTVELFEQDNLGNLVPLRIDKEEKLFLTISDENSKSSGIQLDSKTKIIPIKIICKEVDKGKEKCNSPVLDYFPGKDVSFSSSNRRIIYPVGGVAYLPDNANKKLKIVFEGKDIYTIQAIATKNETAAIHLKNRLKDDYKLENIYIERYKVSNMPNNGFEYKVKIGEFNSYSLAKDLLDELEKRYDKSDYGFFITLKGYK